VTSAETQLLLVRALVLILLYAFLAGVALVTWWDLSSQRRGGRRAAAAASGNVHRLIILTAADSGRPPGQALSLAAVSSIGRDLDNDIVLNDATVSGRHAVVGRRDGAWWVEDLGSTNGTWLNAEPVPAQLPALARSGDVLQFGAVRLRLVSPEEA
jgi:hypothetical protein